MRHFRFWCLVIVCLIAEGFYLVYDKLMDFVNFMAEGDIVVQKDAGERD